MFYPTICISSSSSLLILLFKIFLDTKEVYLKVLKTALLMKSPSKSAGSASASPSKVSG
jgi:hypothetical protein